MGEKRGTRQMGRAALSLLASYTCCTISTPLSTTFDRVPWHQINLLLLGYHLYHLYHSPLVALLLNSNLPLLLLLLHHPPPHPHLHQEHPPSPLVNQVNLHHQQPAPPPLLPLQLLPHQQRAGRRLQQQLLLRPPPRLNPNRLQLVQQQEEEEEQTLSALSTYAVLSSPRPVPLQRC